MKALTLLSVVVLASLLLLTGASPAQTVSVVYSFPGGSNGSGTPEGTLVQGREGRLYGTTFGPPFGSIFRLTANGQFDRLFAFDGGDGQAPSSGVTLASDGNFYGTASYGGNHEAGVLFKITPSRTYTVLHEFGGGADGGYPADAPTEASDGNLYGTTYGPPATSTIFKYSKSGTYSILYTCTSTCLGPTGPLVQGRDGNLYGTSTGAGADDGTVFKITATGTLLDFFNFCVQQPEYGCYPTGGLIQATDGNFYGVTAGGGDYNAGTIFKVLPNFAVSTIYTFQGGTGDGAAPEFGLVQGTDGYLYGATSAGGTDGYGTLFRISTSGAYKLLYSFHAATGATPLSPLLQHTNGKFYGTAGGGGTDGKGTVFALDMGLRPFIAFVQPAGRAGQTAQILGQGLTGTSQVTFNGVAATSFQVVADTYLTAVVPRGATSGPVIVTTPSGALTSNKNFQVIGARTAQ